MGCDCAVEMSAPGTAYAVREHWKHSTRILLWKGGRQANCTAGRGQEK
jgi:hypothetical protein